MTRFTKGRILAFVLAAIFVFFVWGFVFSPQGNGANVILGLAVAIFIIYWATTSVGPTLDDLFFHGGSRERALALREAENAADDIALKMRKMRSRQKSENQSKFDACQAAVEHVYNTVNQIRDNAPGDAKAVAAEIKRAQTAQREAIAAAEGLLGKAAVAPQGFFSGWVSLAIALGCALALRTFIVEPYQIPSGSMMPSLLVGDHLFVSKLSYGVMNPFAKEPSYLLRWNTPKPGDVVVFQAPNYVPMGVHAGGTWIKRVIAGPGQKVKQIDAVLYVDGKPYAHVEPEQEVEYKDFVGEGSDSAFSIGGGKGEWEPRTGVYTREQIGDVVHDIYNNRKEKRRGLERDWPQGGMYIGPYCNISTGLDCTHDECIVQEGYLFVMGDNRGYSSDGRCWGALPIDNVKGKALFIWMSVDGSQNSIKIGQFSLPGFRWSRWFQLIR